MLINWALLVSGIIEDIIQMTTNKSLFFEYMGNLVYVVILTKYGASKQEGLCDIHQGTIRNVLQVEHLYKSECNATDNQ